MLWKTHIRIANEVLHKLMIPESSAEAAKFREGSVTPDEWKDYPHHYGKSSSIREYILKARRFYLNGELSSAYFCLGVALHYIEDSYTSFSSRYESHNLWEQQIEQSYFVDNLEELIAAAFRKREDRRKEYADRIKCLSHKIEGKERTLWLATLPGPGLSIWSKQVWGRPNVDLNFAFRASYLIAQSVLGSRTCSELQTELNRVLSEHERILRETEITFANKITELIRKRDKLKRRVKSSGTFQIIKSNFSALLSKIYHLWVESKIKKYEQQRHLKKVVRKYQDTAQKTIAPHRDWYNITIPKIDMNIIEKELLSTQEVTRSFGISEGTTKYLVEKGRIYCYMVKNQELLSKSELREFLHSHREAY